MIKIKNNTEVNKTWVGQEIEPDAYYEIQPVEMARWANNSVLITAIANAEAVVNDGDADIADVSKAIDYLKNNLPFEVVTQFEKDDKILKLARGSGAVDGNGQAVIEIIVPGTFNGVDPKTSSGRFVDAGRIWMNEGHDGDYVKRVEIVDTENKLGYGAGVVIGKWHDDEAEETENEGWWIPKTAGGVSVDSMGGYGFIPSEMTLRITVQKGSNQTTGTAYLNLKWGKQE